MVGVTLRSSPNTIIKNNIFYNYRGYAINITDSASQQGLDAGYGCVYRSDGGNLSGSPYPHDLWGVAPQFVNPAAGDYHIKPVSKVVDAGIELSQVSEDLDGNPRPQGLGYDIGAYEIPLIFANGFEGGNLSAWSAKVIDGGDLMVTSPAALEGSRGMRAWIDDNLAIYVQDDTPDNEASYNAFFRFDPHSVPMANLDTLTIFAGYDLQSASLQALRVELRFFEGAYQVRAGSRMDDLATWSNTRWFAISDGAHQLAVEWDAAGAPGQNDGQLKLKVDGVLRGIRIGLDTDSLRVDRARLGAFGGIDDGTRGIYFFDQFVSYRD
jgi:hypothetical protein